MGEIIMNRPEGLKLDKSYTLFMVPFCYDVDIDFSKTGFWKLDTDRVSNEGDDGEVLYSYIMDFLQGQMNGGNDSNVHLDIYKLNFDKQSSFYKDFWESFVSHSICEKITFTYNSHFEMFNRFSFFEPNEFSSQKVINVNLFGTLAKKRYFCTK